MVPAASVGVPDRFMVLVRYKIPTSYLRLTTLLLRQSGRFFSRNRKLRSPFFSELSYTFHTKGLFILPIDYLSTESIMPMDRCIYNFLYMYCSYNSERQM